MKGTHMAPSGTLGLAPGSDRRLGGTVRFAYTFSGKLTKKGKLIISVEASQNGEQVYQDRLPAEGAAFVLGGAASPWTVAGGPAQCHAELFIDYPDQPGDVLARVTFDAAA